MRLGQGVVMVALCAAVLLARSTASCAQTQESDRTLEVPQRLVAPPPQAPAAAASSEPAGSADGSDSGDDAGDSEPAGATGNLPYLGLTVQYIISNDTPGQEVHGLEVVSVDPASPAELAGLHGRGTLTKIGASGATAGALMAPLDLLVMPLLKKTGQLGEVGDLIVAIDDNRVQSADDLKTALENAKAGDTLYLTVVRQRPDETKETLKIPVKLGAPADASGSRTAESTSGKASAGASPASGH